MKGIYLGAYQDVYHDYDIVYQDINGKRDIGGSMLDIDLNKFDFIICTPPCNYWSRGSNILNRSNYAVETGLLLPEMLERLERINKPYIVENVRNKIRFEKFGILPREKSLVYFIGRHTIFTNIMFNTYINYDFDFTNINGSCVDVGKRSDRQGGLNVHRIIEKWLYTIHYEDYVKLEH